MLKSWYNTENCFQITCISGNVIYGFHFGRRKEHWDALHQGVQSQTSLGAGRACMRWPGNDTAGCGCPTPTQSTQLYKVFKDCWASQMWQLFTLTKDSQVDLHSGKRRGTENQGMARTVPALLICLQAVVFLHSTHLMEHTSAFHSWKTLFHCNKMGLNSTVSNCICVVAR